MSAASPRVELDAALAAADAVDLARRLVRIPSHPGVPRQEEAVVTALAGWLDERDIGTAVDEAAPGRPNLIATLDSGRPGRHLTLCGHTDTVPLNADDAGGGFSGELRDGLLVGRGSVDMKGALAAMAAALVGLRESGALAAGRVTLAALVDEEMSALGVERLVGTEFRADGAVVGEPSENRLLIGHKGLEWVEIGFVGQAAHGGSPERGVNAIAAAARFAELARTDLGPRFAAREHPVLGRPTLNLGTIRGGDQPSTVAATCHMSMDRRSVPGESWASIVAELEELLAAVGAATPGLSWSVRRVADGFGTEEKLAFVTEAEHPLVRSAAAAVAAVREGPVELGAFPAWTDGGTLAANGTPVVILGPGELALAHSPREAVPVAQVIEAARIYARIAVDFCAGAADTPSSSREDET